MHFFKVSAISNFIVKSSEASELAKHVKTIANCTNKSEKDGEGNHFLHDAGLSKKQVANLKFCNNCFKEVNKLAIKNQLTYPNILKKIVPSKKKLNC
jgi:hypothetical protein